MDKKRDWLQIIGALVFYAMATTALLISVYLLDALDGYLSGSMRVYVTLGIGIILSVFLAIVTNPVKKKRRRNPKTLPVSRISGGSVTKSCW